MATRWIPNAPWPDADVAKLRALLDQGMTYTQIGEAIGRSRAAVSAKCKQLRLSNMAKLQRLDSKRDANGHFAPTGKTTPERAGAVTLPPLPSLMVEC